MAESRTNFGSKFGFIVVAAGSAIGLGNLWKFPYLVGKYGGGAFVFVYLFFAIFIGAFVILAEVLIGRIAQKNSVDCFGTHKKDGKSFGWKFFGGIGLFSSLLITFFYPIIAGWVVEYIFRGSHLALQSDEVIKQTFTSITHNVGVMILTTFFVLFLTNSIVARGLVEGTEKFGLVLLPLLFVLLITLTIRSFFLENSAAGIAYYLKPDFSKIGKDAVLAALGQAFFSLSVGSGLMLTFGSYMKKEACSFKSSLSVMSADTLVAFMAGFIVMPSLFAYGLSPTTAGPGLVFVSFPTIFAHMKGGVFWAPVFFFLVFIAAITTTLSLSEALVTFLTERFSLTRVKAATYLTIVQCIATVFVILSLAGKFNVGGMSLFDGLDNATTIYLIPIAALTVCLYVGFHLRKVILSRSDELITAPFNKYANVLVGIISFVLPPVIAFVIYNGIFGV